MARPRADEASLQQVRRVLAEAQRKGSDPAELLDRAGLIMHPALGLMIAREALGELARVLDEIKVAQLAKVLGQRIPTTALDTKQYIVQWIRDAADADLP